MRVYRADRPVRIHTRVLEVLDPFLDVPDLAIGLTVANITEWSSGKKLLRG
jgi:hypothetical protein